MRQEENEMTEQDNLIQFPGSPEISCPVCESKNVVSRMEPESFSYGAGKDAVNLSAVVPVRRCQDCGFEFTDEVADRVKHNAVCQQLGVMNPDQITSIREQFGLSRAEFARATKIGEASINRWENGLLIQNAAMDQYLFLLSFAENFERIRRRPEEGTSHEPVVSNRESNVFVVLSITDRVRSQARAFSL
jgi:putative zinc finger/helix-turn-helix YgiT family protein